MLLLHAADTAEADLSETECHTTRSKTGWTAHMLAQEAGAPHEDVADEVPQKPSRSPRPARQPVTEALRGTQSLIYLKLRIVVSQLPELEQAKRTD